MSKTCCFTGHRPHSLGFSEKSNQCEILKTNLEKEIIYLVEEENVTNFISGMAIGVDTYAAEIILELKKHYHIYLECALPCETQASKWNEVDRNRYYDVLKHCDKVTLLQKRYTADCMMNRNKYMVDNSDFIIAVWNGKPSGTGNTVRYAKLNNKKNRDDKTVKYKIYSFLCCGVDKY